jgi:hypothetical protein
MEAIGGARLYQIVVEDEEVSKTLIKTRAFGNIHVVFIPNSKILSHPIHPDVDLTSSNNSRMSQEPEESPTTCSARLSQQAL